MLYLGIDLGGTNIKAGLVNEEGKLIVKDSIKTKNGQPYEVILKDMAMLALKVAKDNGYDINSDVVSIGVGSPGTPDKENGILVYTNNLPFRNVPMREELQKYINLPVYIDNDANCAALAESVAGAAKEADCSVTITLGTGIGCGVIIDNRIYSGFNYAAPEGGHAVIVVDGESCTCGRKGCWEAYASATGLIRQTKRAAEENPKSLINSIAENDLNNISARTPFLAARENDPTGIMVVKQYIKYLAAGLTNVINMFQPEILAIGGGICNEGDYLLNPVKDMVYKEVYSKEPVKQTKIVRALMGNDAGIIGAAMLK